ncbi:L-amino acid oxidase [Coprinopsis cinerea okayama7|uniref:L-amino acid oxidase n=1 Tax=Coprinopsis cinerea (strain Okayama-7 / 130 / ATCC MYA-4618 / FGSC 9003) TaxID=240176 RepID=A8NBN1_COPC7|nr:L-amino acid oxidase [Coprinopsis cinerea okayama7\|eukprot:XP_001832229.1 L-amino acid oxidase [Coprinopsis cinerea okayama7\
MSRPKILSATGTSVKIELPTGWFVNISAISRRPYNQLVTIDFDVEGDEKSHYLINKWGQANVNQAMRDLDSSEDVVTIIPQREKVVIDINTYFSTTSNVREEALKNDKYRSSRANILGTTKPSNAPPGFPDYTTYLIFVEDSPPDTQVKGAPEYDDALITLNIMEGDVKSVPPPPIDTGSQAISQTGKEAVDHFINLYTDPTIPGPYIDPGTLTPKPKPDPPSPYPVGIIGAGIAGLYTALMLDSLGIKYEILEGSGRVGGRLYTHRFRNHGDGKYQYYDVGAMRYPDTTFMRRTFDLAQKRLGIKMLPYLRSNDNAFMCFNGITVTKKRNNEANLVKEDIFKVTEANDGQIPEDEFRKGSSYFWDEILREFRQYFVDYPFPQAFEKLKRWEEHSVRSYLLVVKKIPYVVVDWYEKMESRTGLFDQSLTETVLASLVFMDPNKANQEVGWFCFDGGSEVLHEEIRKKLSTQPKLHMRAVQIKEEEDGKCIAVEFDSRRDPRPSAQGRSVKKFSNVICTMSFACLRMVDLDGLYLSYGQRNAIRTLAYTPSIKIGIQFKTAWWEKLGIEGGQSSTDRPIRDCVYPSYPSDSTHPGSKYSNCMIAAYNGMQDSQRLGGLMKGRDTPEERVMLELVMRDLAALHNKDVDELWDQYEDYYPWDFYRDEFQLGAFCQFGPGQFANVYPHVTQPASTKQRFHFAGDACSTFHGWVAGALNSAWRAVLGMLIAHPELNPNPNEDIIAKFKKEWGATEEWDEKTLAKLTYLNREITKYDLEAANKP